MPKLSASKLSHILDMEAQEQEDEILDTLAFEEADDECFIEEYPTPDEWGERDPWEWDSLLEQEAWYNDYYDGDL